MIYTVKNDIFIFINNIVNITKPTIEDISLYQNSACKFEFCTCDFMLQLMVNTTLVSLVTD